VGFHRQGRLNEAIGHYRQTLVIQPNYPDAHYNLGNALLQNGQFDEGRAHLEAAKSLH
jgi:tetratricopeptide (TPR) repeat protein